MVILYLYEVLLHSQTLLVSGLSVTLPLMNGLTPVYIIILIVKLLERPKCKA